MPLVHADAKHWETDATHYVTVSDGTVGGKLDGTFGCTPVTTGAEKIDVFCERPMTVNLAKAEGARTKGYWFGVVMDMPTSGDVNLSKSTVKVGGKTYNLTVDNGGVLDGANWFGAWNKVDESKIGSTDRVKVATYEFTLWDNTEGETYTQEVNVYLDYSKAKITFNNTPKDSGVYQIKVGEYVDGKVTDTIHTVEVPYVDGNETNKKVSEVVGNALNQYMNKAGYTFKGWFKNTGDAVVKTSYLNLAETPFEDMLKITAVYEKDPNYVAPAEKPSTTKPADKDKDSTPKTGNTDLMGFVPLMTLLSLVGIVTLKKTI